MTTGNIRQTTERVLTLVALAATAYIALHKFYAEVKPKASIPPGREQTVIKTFPTRGLSERELRRARQRHWPCFILAIMLVLISTGGMLDLALLVR